MDGSTTRDTATGRQCPVCNLLYVGDENCPQCDEQIVGAVLENEELQSELQDELEKLKPSLFPITRETLRGLRFNKDDRLHVGINKDLTQFTLTVSNERGHIWLSPAARAGWFQRIPERKCNDGFPGIQYMAAATDCTAIVISTLWPTEQVTFDDDALDVYRYLLTTIVSQEANVKLVARYREYSERKEQIQANAVVCPHVLDGEPEWIEKTKPANPELELALYQKVAAVCAARSEGYALFMEQGTGKTPVGIAVMCEAARRLQQRENRLLRVLVVCPKNVRMNWEHEIHRFKTCEGTTTIPRKGAMTRTRMIIEAMVPRLENQMFTAVIVGYETLVQSYEMISRIEWDLVLGDEIHFIKSPNTKRTKHLHKMRDVSGQRIEMTGTPITNTPLDLWSQFEFLGKGFSGFNNWQAFKGFYGVFAQHEGDGIKRIIGVQNLPFMQERIARVSFVIRQEEALPNLPDKVYDVYEVDMTEQQTEVYEKIKTHLVAEIEDDLERGEHEHNKQLVVNNILTKMLRLAQITSGHITWDPVRNPDTGEIVRPKIIEDFVPNPKLDGLIELLKDKDPRDKTLVWACWVHDVKRIAERLTREGIDHVLYYGGTSDEQRIESERRFNFDRNCKVFVGNPAAGGTGLNLIGYPPGDTSGEYDTDANHVIYYSQNWSSTARSQSEARAHRRGTRRNVRITDLCVPSTIDVEIRARVTDKRATAMEITDLREMLRRVLAE